MTNEEQSAILSGMREILSSEEKWTVGALARNLNGTSVAVTDPAAVCFCLVGAYIRSRSSVTGEAASVNIDEWFLNRHASRYPHWTYPLAAWNDNAARYEDVIALLEE